MWSSKSDGQYISANVSFEIIYIKSFYKKEFDLINKALLENKFMYDASDVMEDLLELITSYGKNYIDLGF